MKRTIVPTPAFLRSSRRYLRRHPRAAGVINATLQVLGDDAFDSRLGTHKLKGHLKDAWSVSAGYDLRIVFEFGQLEGVEAIFLLEIGTHDEVY